MCRLLMKGAAAKDSRRETEIADQVPHERLLQIRPEDGPPGHQAPLIIPLSEREAV